ncbi:hypothetical protein D3C80_1995620 [compost metagenome]
MRAKDGRLCLTVLLNVVAQLHQRLLSKARILFPPDLWLALNFTRVDLDDALAFLNGFLLLEVRQLVDCSPECVRFLCRSHGISLKP